MHTYINGKYLLLGTNLGERKVNLEEAVHHLDEAGIHVIEMSSIYESEPWGISNQPWFLNRVIRVETDLPPGELLEVILDVEIKMGRVRKIKWGERLIDIDILFYDDKIIHQQKPDLTIPHPEIQNRKFTLAPLAEMIPDSLHPVLRKSMQELKEKCIDPLNCEKISGN